MGLHNPEFAVVLGDLVTYWPHLEEQMIDFFALLMGETQDFPARQIFRSIVAQSARVKVMKALLERTRTNRDKDEEYDRIVTDFAALNDLRNVYVHGLWLTHESSRVFLSELALDDFHFLKKREVRLEELKTARIRMGNLWLRARALRQAKIAKLFEPAPLLEIPPEQPGDETP